MKYFTIKELTQSNVAKQRGIDNTPGEKEVANLTNLVEKVLDPLRVMYENPIKVTSGYRSKELNASVKGSATSSHMRGEAADITCLTGNQSINYVLGTIIYKNFDYDQLIFENVPVNGKSCEWIHVSYSSTRNRKQALKKIKGKNVYLNIKP